MALNSEKNKLQKMYICLCEHSRDDTDLFEEHVY